MLIIVPTLCGLIAFVFIDLLCQPDEVFGWWLRLLRWLLFGDADRIVDFDQMAWWQLTIYKPLAGCAKCCAGWVSIVAYFLVLRLPFDFFTLVPFVCGAVFMAWMLSAWKEKIGLTV